MQIAAHNKALTQINRHRYLTWFLSFTVLYLSGHLISLYFIELFLMSTKLLNVQGANSIQQTFFTVPIMIGWCHKQTFTRNSIYPSYCNYQQPTYFLIDEGWWETERSVGAQQLPGLWCSGGRAWWPPSSVSHISLSRPWLWIWQQFSVAADRDKNQADRWINALTPGLQK